MLIKSWLAWLKKPASLQQLNFDGARGRGGVGAWKQDLERSHAPHLPRPHAPQTGVDDTTKTAVFHTYRIGGDREMIEIAQK